MTQVLAREGHAVHAAADVATALELANAQQFDLMLSDLGLPDGSGLDLLRALRGRGHLFPAIALSGYGQEQDIAQSLAAGFAQHLTKPVNMPRLIEAVTAQVSNAARAAEAKG
jgi:DNA-binding response OmpR family regulator